MKISNMGTKLFLTLIFFFSIIFSAEAAILTFDDAISGATNYNFDADGDNISDVTFSTTDPAGFNAVGPGPNMSYIDEPGLEGTTLLSPDIRVDFLFGAIGSIRFGFALATQIPNAGGVAFTVYDSGDNVLGTQSVLADFTLPDGTNPSTFPEGRVNVSFSGTAAYATFDFSGSGERYIIDNFEGAFGSTTNATPIPTMNEWGMIIMSLILAGSAIRMMRRRQAA